MFPRYQRAVDLMSGAPGKGIAPNPPDKTRKIMWGEVDGVVVISED